MHSSKINAVYLYHNLCAAQIMDPQQILDWVFQVAETAVLKDEKFLYELSLWPSIWYIHGSVTAFTDTIYGAATLAAHNPDLRFVVYAWSGGRAFSHYWRATMNTSSAAIRLQELLERVSMQEVSISSSLWSWLDSMDRKGSTEEEHIRNCKM